MGERQTLTISLYCERKAVNMPLADAVEWLNATLESVPKEYRDNAWFDVSLDYGFYDDPTELDFQIYYNRLETEEEVIAREADEARRKEASRLYEIARMKDNIARLESQVRSR